MITPKVLAAEASTDTAITLYRYSDSAVMAARKNHDSERHDLEMEEA
jgi:hypothetical protein